MKDSMRYRMFGMALLASSALVLTGCPSDTETDTNNDTGIDTETDAGTPDTGAEDPSCEVSEDCTGSFAGFECVDGTCTDCAVGEEGCTCLANGSCDEGLVCGDDALCVPCEAGTEQCPCDDGGLCEGDLVCDAESSLCVPDTCVDGALDCPCDSGACSEANAFCDDSDLCRECTSDLTGCPCDEEDSCQNNNFCDDGLCEACPEEFRPEGCDCDTTLDCDTGLVCDEDAGTCRERKSCDDLCVPNQECDEEMTGDPVCVVETCVDGYVWDNGACVVQLAQTCDGRNDSVDLSSTCTAQNQECVEDANGEAVCVDTCSTIDATCDAEFRQCEASITLTGNAVCGACIPGYAEDATGTCMPDADANCSTFGDTDSIYDTCQALNQECVPGDPDGATCGDCLSGFEVSSVTGLCVETSLCGGELCEADEYCAYPQIGGPPACQPKQCGTDQAFDEDTSTCVSCNLSCADGVYPTLVDGGCACAEDVFCNYATDGSASRCFVNQCGDGEALTANGVQCKSCARACGTNEGERTRLWPVTSNDNSCLCETLEGYYFPLGGGGVPAACDEDDDGWINETANVAYLTAEADDDAATLGNFRCERRQIDRFILQNELGQQRAVSLCDDEMVDYDPDTVYSCSDPDGIVELTLVEPNALDDEDQITVDDVNFPAYGTRKFSAAEVNGLTKACVSANADFNGNGIEDVSEEQAIERNRLTTVAFGSDEEFAFNSMSFFSEMHRGFYQSNALAYAPGAYHIVERSRCDGDLALDYFEGSDWANECTRLRRADYDYAESHVGFDFAHFSCSDTASGSCGVPDPLVDSNLDDVDGDNIPDHGYCERSDAVANTPWRGMMHHSQYQCVVLKNTPSASANEELALNELYQAGDANTGPYELNECAPVDCSAGGAGCEEYDNLGPYQARQTLYSCETEERDNATQDTVGWVAIRYLSEASTGSLARPYQRGCMDESFGFDGSDGYIGLCPGYEDNPEGVLASGSIANFGRLMCSCNLFYGGTDCSVSCIERSYADITDADALSTTFVHVGGKDVYSAEERSAYDCSSEDFYCKLADADPSIGFLGGRQGYWMCGETSLTHTVDASGADTPALEGTAPSDGAVITLTGQIGVMPVKRELLTEDGCVADCYSAF